MNIANIILLQIFIAVITTFLTIFLKVVSRNDHLARFQREDLVFGFDISATALILFVLGMVNLASLVTTNTGSQNVIEVNKLLISPWILFSFFIGTWSISSLTRWFGWNHGEPHLIWGIAVPNFWGLFILISSVLILGYYL